MIILCKYIWYLRCSHFTLKANGKRVGRNKRKRKKCSRFNEYFNIVFHELKKKKATRKRRRERSRSGLKVWTSPFWSPCSAPNSIEFGLYTNTTITNRHTGLKEFFIPKPSPNHKFKVKPYGFFTGMHRLVEKYNLLRGRESKERKILLVTFFFILIVYYFSFKLFEKILNSLINPLH